MKCLKNILMIILVITLCACNKIIIDELPKGYYLEIKEEPIEIYSDIKVSDLIKNTNIISDNLNKSIDTNKLGSHTFDFKFKINNKNYLYHINYTVVDTTKPKIFGSTSKTFYVGNVQNICDLVMYGDNYDKKPNCSVEGEYDFTKVGKYKVKITITDSSNNLNNFNMTINIIENKKNNNLKNNIEPTNVLFSDVYKTYKNEHTKIGLDVSRWQEDVDYKQVKESGAEFIMMRIGVQQDYEEEPRMDSKYLQNIKNAKEAGLEVGVYFYSMAKSTTEAREQAKWVLKTLDKEKLDLPIVFDWESWTEWNKLNLSFYDINAIADSFLKTITSNGYEAMLYGSKFYLENIWENNYNYPIWLAHYTNNTLTDYKGNYLMWQLCSDGKISGINGDVDINILFK